MHQYLRAVGFSKIKTKNDLKNLLNDVIAGYDDKNFIETDHNTLYVEYSKRYAGPCGLTVRGEYERDDNLTLDFYYPFIKGDQTSTGEDITVERHAEKESFAGVCDDTRIAVSIIFYVQNGVEYMRTYAAGEITSELASVRFAGLSINGTIMLPIKKNAKEKALAKKAINDRTQRIVAARNGDEEALESLTLEDIDTYSTVSKRLLKEDIFSIVDTYFMPYGVECDQYSILGEIEDCRIVNNYYSDETVYVMKINCNDMIFDICINSEDLLGEPKKGRRFKGTMWLQGHIDFSSSEASYEADKN